jgi:hypothetical protein
MASSRPSLQLYLARVFVGYPGARAHATPPSHCCSHDHHKE